mgnify:FL=1
MKHNKPTRQVSMRMFLTLVLIYKIKEYEKQIKSDNVGGGSAAVECKCAGFQNRQMRRQHHMDS